MGAILTSGNSAFRDHVTQGDAGSGAHEPILADARAFAAVIDNVLADTQDLGGESFAGAWEYPRTMKPGGAGTLAVTAGRMYMAPIFINRPIDRVGLQVSSGTPGNVRTGLYAHDGAGKPGALALDFGANAMGAGFNEFSFAETSFEGLYWLAMIFSGTPTMVVGDPAAALVGAPSGSFNVFHAGVYKTQAYGALPASAASLTAMSPTVPLIGVRNA